MPTSEGTSATLRAARGPYALAKHLCPLYPRLLMTMQPACRGGLGHSSSSRLTGHPPLCRQKGSRSRRWSGSRCTRR